MRRLPTLIIALLAVLSLTIGLRWWLQAEQDHDRPARPTQSLAARSESQAASALEIPASRALSVPVEPLPDDSADTGAASDAQRTALHSELVTLFEHGLNSAEFATGERWQVGLGFSNEGAAFANDQISAVDIPSGLQLTLFDDAQGQGFKLTLGPGRHELAPYGFSDRTSSLQVSRYGQSTEVSGPEDCVVLYEHRAADVRGRGLAWRLELPRARDVWTFRVAHGAFLDNQASTAWVAQGFELVLFDDLEANGAALVLGPGLHELELMGFNDRASAARVRRVRAGL